MPRIAWKLPLVGALLFGALPAEAGALRVLPITLDLRPPVAAGSITLRNEGREPMNVQIRVLRWTQDGGPEDALVPTRDVAASPPLATLAPGADYVVRVVRTARTPVTGEEAYRLLVDELPRPAARRSGTISFLVRQSIPVFFSPGNGGRPQVAWSARLSGRTLRLSADNRGAQRLKLSDLTVKGQNGAVLRRQNGLAGYVLAGSTKSWTIQLGAGAKPGTGLAIGAVSDGSPVNAQAPVSLGN
jgi:fimbrial chaperone protein